MKKFVITCFSLLTFTFSIAAFAQQSTTSFHRLEVYKNQSLQKKPDLKLAIVVDKDTIEAVNVDSGFTFPLIDTTKRYSYLINSNGLIFETGKYHPKSINSGSRLYFGNMSKLKRLLSVAEYNGTTPDEPSYEADSHHYFFIGQMYTIDLSEISNIKSLRYLIISPNQIGKGWHFINTQIVSKKKL